MFKNGTINLVIALTGIFLVWGVLLPMVSQTEFEQKRQAMLEERQIDPSAMFYTELDTISDLIERLDHQKKK